MDSFDIKLLISIAFTLAYSIVYLVETSNANTTSNIMQHSK